MTKWVGFFRTIPVLALFVACGNDSTNSGGDDGGGTRGGEAGTAGEPEGGRGDAGRSDGGDSGRGGSDRTGGAGGSIAGQAGAGGDSDGGIGGESGGTAGEAGSAGDPTGGTGAAAGFGGGVGATAGAGGVGATAGFGGVGANGGGAGVEAMGGMSGAGAGGAPPGGYGGFPCGAQGGSGQSSDVSDAEDSANGERIRASAYDEPCTNGATRKCCRAGTQTCAAGTWGPCVGAFLSNESCNSVDDDCDGAVDELGSFTCGTGACERTVTACADGELATCIPGVPTTTTDACNGVDDDCDGAVDEDCETCLHVAPTGDDAAAMASNGTTPFSTVQTAIDFAHAHRDVATRVCVAAGAACGSTATYAAPPGAHLTMRDGISVYANYESTTWTRCTNSTTRLAPQAGGGVVFPACIASRTILDGFAIDRAASDTTAGVTVDGARGVELSNLSIAGGPDVNTSYGVNIMNGGRVRIFRSHIDSGGAPLHGVALRAVDSEVIVEGSCSTPPNPGTGLCTEACSATGPGILATYSTVDYRNPIRTDAVVLENSPRSRIERSSICTSLNARGLLGEASVIRVTGNATGLVLRGNVVMLEGGRWPALLPDKTAISMTDCGGASPWFLQNAATARSSEIVSVVTSAGDCHPVLEANSTISSIIVGPNVSTAAVLCEASAGVASQCVIANNSGIRTDSEMVYANANQSFHGTAVRCTGGSCARIDDNIILGLGSGCCYRALGDGTGISLASESVVVARNRVTGISGPACASSGVGISAAPARGLMEDNVVLGAYLTLNASCETHHTATGLSIASAPEREWIVRSNEIRALPGTSCGAPICCDPTLGCGTLSSRFQPFLAPPVSLSMGGNAGVFENNAILSGTCADTRAVSESTDGAHPRLFENNHLTANVTGGPVRGGFLYKDSTLGGLVTPEAVDALPDTLASGTTAETCQ